MMDAWVNVVESARRIGVKGPSAARLLDELGLSAPAHANTWGPLRASVDAAAADVVARLGHTEFFLEEHGGAPGIAALESALAGEPVGAYPVLRADVGLTIGGPRAADALAQVCNVDLAQFDARSRPIYMTTMIGVSVLALPQARDASIVYRIWCDPSYGSCLASALEEIVQELSAGSER